LLFKRPNSLMFCWSHKRTYTKNIITCSQYKNIVSKLHILQQQLSSSTDSIKAMTHLNFVFSTGHFIRRVFNWITVIYITIM
jgi:hypothetical protein